MKKVLVLVMALLMMFALAACGGGDTVVGTWEVADGESGGTYGFGLQFNKDGTMFYAAGGEEGQDLAEAFEAMKALYKIKYEIIDDTSMELTQSAFLGLVKDDPIPVQYSLNGNTLIFDGATYYRVDEDGNVVGSKDAGKDKDKDKDKKSDEDAAVEDDGAEDYDDGGYEYEEPEAFTDKQKEKIESQAAKNDMEVSWLSDYAYALTPVSGSTVTVKDYWPDDSFELFKLIPEPSGTVEAYYNYGDSCHVSLSDIEIDEADKYIKQLKKAGFDQVSESAQSFIDSYAETDSARYYLADNGKGYRAEVTFMYGQTNIGIAESN